MDYYYNNVPGIGLTRNNLIYTSLISKDQKLFCQWYYNDTEYHQGQNQVVNLDLMEEKWNREIKFLSLMNNSYPDLIPKYKVDFLEKKIYLEIDGNDFWNRSCCSIENYNKTLPDWQEQMIDIIKAHKFLGIHKYSMHPSSYFIVDGKLKSINYFFSYHKDESFISIKDVESHIYSTRQIEMKKYLEPLKIKWDEPQTWETMDKLCWNSFRTNYPTNFIEKILCII